MACRIDFQGSACNGYCNILRNAFDKDIKKIKSAKHYYMEALKDIMKFIKWLKDMRYMAVIKLYSLLPIQNNKIIVWSDSFKSYGCNPKYIVEYILENYKDEFDIVWVFDACLPQPEQLPEGVRVVKYFSKEYLYELHTAHFIVCNARTSDSYLWHKRKRQIYIQTWHSSLRLKTIEKDAAEFLPEQYISAAKKDSQKIDYIISGCKFSSNIFRNSFWYSGKIVECGTPRTDFLLKNKNNKELLKKANLSDKYHYILYAPTFRQTDQYEYKFDFKSVIKAFENKFGGNWKILYRLHPNLIFKVREYQLGDECINMCCYSDMQELIALSDALITDYSSCMFDMMYAKKPCFLYMPDYENYINSERKMYFDIKQLPFIRAFNEKELAASVYNFNHEEYLKELSIFLDKIGSFEKGTATEAIVDIITGKREGLCE